MIQDHPKQMIPLLTYHRSSMEAWRVLNHSVDVTFSRHIGISSSHTITQRRVRTVHYFGRDYTTPWTLAYEAPLSIGFSGQGYWCGLPWYILYKCIIALKIGFIYWISFPMVTKSLPFSQVSPFTVSWRSKKILDKESRKADSFSDSATNYFFWAKLFNSSSMLSSRIHEPTPTELPACREKSWILS